MLFALIAAAGQSKRMGMPKLLLPLSMPGGGPPRTVLEHVIGAFQAGGVERVLVIATPLLPELATVAERAGAVACVLPEETPDMRATIEYGLQWAEKKWSPAPMDAWFLSPADHPAMESAVVARLAAASHGDKRHTVFVPTFRGRRGHPALIAWSHVAAMRDFPRGQGLNAYLRETVGSICEVSVDHGGILHDLDTPEDYRRLSSP